MSRVPVLNFERVVRALRRDGWIVVRQRGSHIRLQKRTSTETLRIIVPAHRPIKRSTLAHILKQARLTPEELQKLVWDMGGIRAGGAVQQTSQAR